MNNTENIESISPTGVTRISLPTSSDLILGSTIPLQIPTKTNRSNSDIHNDPNTSEKIRSQDISFEATRHQFFIQNTVTLPFSLFNKTRGNIPMYNPFTDYMNQIQNNPTVTNQLNRPNDQKFTLNTITTTVPNLSRLPLAPPGSADTYSLSSTNSKPFQTKTNLKASANPCQTVRHYINSKLHLIKLPLQFYFHHLSLKIQENFLLYLHKTKMYLLLQ